MRLRIDKRFAVVFALLVSSVVWLGGCTPKAETNAQKRLIPAGLGSTPRQSDLPFGVIARLGGGERLAAPIASVALTTKDGGEGRGRVFVASDAGISVYGAKDGIPQRPLVEPPEDRKDVRAADPFEMFLSHSQHYLVTTSLSWEQSVQIWDVKTRRRLRVLERPSSFRPIVRGAPNADAIVVVYEDRLERYALDGSSSPSVFSLTDDDSGWRVRVRDLAYTPDGQRVVIVGSGGIEVRELTSSVANDDAGADVDATPDKRSNVLERITHPEGFQHVAISMDGERVALARPASRIEVRRLGELSESGVELELGPSLDRVEKMAFTLGGEVLLASVIGAGGEETVRIYDVSEARELGRIAATDFAVREDGFLTIAAGQMLRRFQVDESAGSARGVRSLELGVGHVMPPEQLQIMDGTSSILSTSRDGEVILWDLEKFGGEVIREGQIARVGAAAPSADGAAIFTAAYDRASSSFQLEKRARNQEDAPAFVRSLRAPVARLSADNTEQKLLGVSPRGVLWRWSLLDGEALERWPLGGQRSRFAGASEALEWVAILEPGANELRVWRTEDGFLYQAYSWPDEVAICDGRASARAFVCADSDFLRWIPLKPRRSVRTQPHGFARVDGVSFSPQSSHIAIWGLRPGRRDDRLELWLIPLESGEKTRIFTKVPSQITAAAFFPGGRYLATGHVDGLVRVWDLEARAKPSER